MRAAIDRLEQRINQAIATAAVQAAARPDVKCATPECEEVGWWSDSGLCHGCEQRLRAERELAERRTRWAESMGRLGVPRAYAAVPPSMDLPPSCAGWRGVPWSVTILGPTGAGKTWVGIRLLMELYCTGADGCLFADAPTVLDRIKAEINSRDDLNGRGLFGELMKVGALLLDDISAVRDTDFQRDRLVLLLRERFNAQRPTIITSNKATLAELATEHLDAPIGSRLASGIVVLVKGKDRRLA